MLWSLYQDWWGASRRNSLKYSAALADPDNSVYHDWFYEFREAAIKQGIAKTLDLIYCVAQYIWTTIRCYKLPGFDYEVHFYLNRDLAKWLFLNGRVREISDILWSSAYNWAYYVK